MNWRRRKTKTCPVLFFLCYKCLNSACELDVLLTEHSLQLLYPSLRLKDPKLAYNLLMPASLKKSIAGFVNLGLDEHPAGMKYLQAAKYFKPAPCQSHSQFTSTAASGGLLPYLPIFTRRWNNMGEWLIDRVLICSLLLHLASQFVIHWHFS